MYKMSIATKWPDCAIQTSTRRAWWANFLTYKYMFYFLACSGLPSFQFPNCSVLHGSSQGQKMSSWPSIPCPFPWTENSCNVLCHDYNPGLGLANEPEPYTIQLQSQTWSYTSNSFRLVYMYTKWWLIHKSDFQHDISCCLIIDEDANAAQRIWSI